MKSLMLLWKRLAQECASRCHTSATLDCKTVQRRSKHEGMSFLTISLPGFGKDFEKSLSQGWVGDDLFLGFTRAGGLPRFLSGFLRRVFDQSSGVLFDEPCVDSIRSIRQLTLMFGKIKLQCTPEREAAAFAEFVDCEQDVRYWDSLLSPQQKWDFQRISTLLFKDLFTRIDREIYYGRHVPKHGPGATADGLRGNAKFVQNTWTRRLEEYFHSTDMLLPNIRYLEYLDDVDILEPDAEIPVKVVSVPKTQKTPRIIAIEPTAMQYAQQAVLAEIRGGLPKENYLRSMIGIQDQSPNQAMALKGSRDGSLATLDLSEASDRVSNQHVRLLFDRYPALFGAVDASRSRKADVPGKGVIRLAKFASMGSALTFPVEAMVFLTIIFMGIERELNTPLSEQHLKSLFRSVRVYGDDIIVPTDYVDSVIESLEAFGLLVNFDKSHWTGRFRESCGKEYYSGEDVSIVRVREVFPTQRRHAKEVISLVSLRNQLYWAGYWETVKWLDERIREVIKHFPMVLPSSPVLGRQSALGYETQRLGEHLHDPQVKGWKVSAKSPSDKLDGHGALLKFLLRQGNAAHRENDELYFPNPDARHLERAGRPQRVDIKLGWYSSI